MNSSDYSHHRPLTLCVGLVQENICHIYKGNTVKLITIAIPYLICRNVVVHIHRATVENGQLRRASLAHNRGLRVSAMKKIKETINPTGQLELAEHNKINSTEYYYPTPKTGNKP